MGKGYKLTSNGGSISSTGTIDKKNDIPHNADILGNKYTAKDIEAMSGNVAKLGGVEFIFDEETGAITGYKTPKGGADTVFPFNAGGQ